MPDMEINGRDVTGWNTNDAIARSIGVVLSISCWYHTLTVAGISCSAWSP